MVKNQAYLAQLLTSGSKTMLLQYIFWGKRMAYITYVELSHVLALSQTIYFVIPWNVWKPCSNLHKNERDTLPSFLLCQFLLYFIKIYYDGAGTLNFVQVRLCLALCHSVCNFYCFETYENVWKLELILCSILALAHFLLGKNVATLVVAAVF